MIKFSHKHCLYLIIMLIIGMNNLYAQSVVDFGTDLFSTKYYESMNAANPPAGEWYAVDYDDSSWNTYTNPLDFPEYDAFWVRRTFFITDDPANHSFQLKIAHDDGAYFYINGHIIHDDSGCCNRYNYIDVPSEYLVNGQNVLAVYVIDTGGDQCLECFISATDGSDIIFDLPTEPTLLLSKSNIRLYYGVTGYSDCSINAKLLTPTGLVDNAQVTWTSSNLDVVTVTNGHIVSLSAGNAVVTASVVYNGVTYSKECAVEVCTIAPGTKFVAVNEAGTLGSLLTDDEKDNISSLTVVGNLDSDDISVLRTMSSQGKLADLDMYGTSMPSIGGYAFCDCRSLTSIVLPYDLKTIGESVFMGCSSLTSIDLPDGLIRIGASAFWGCTSLLSITIPSSLTEMGYSYSEPNFGQCFNLKEIIIKSPVISDNFFHYFREGRGEYDNYGNFREQWEVVMPAVVEFPEGTTKISNSSFSEIRELQSFTIPSTVTIIEDYAFNNCSSLTSLTIPKGLISIGNYAFNNCSSLTSLTLPEGLTAIGNCAFRGDSTLLNIVLPSNLKTIGNEAFEGCSSLTNINLPKGIINVGGHIFANCSSLSSVTIEDGITELWDDIFYGLDGLENVIIPSSVSRIGNNTFRSCSSLKTILIPQNVKSIGDYAFSGCYSLENISFSEGLKDIGNFAFNECYSLQSVVLPEGLDSIGCSVFYNCYLLSSVTIPSSLRYIGYDYDYMTFGGCSNIKYINIKSPIIADDFFHCFRDGSRQKGWGNQLYEDLKPSVVIFPEGTTQISENAFMGCSEMISFVVPSTVKEIGASAFKDCSSLVSIEIPLGVESIGSSAFRDCSSLDSINIPEGVKSIGASSFYNCNLKSITIPSTVLEIGYDEEYSTFRCDSLSTIIIKSPIVADDFYHNFREGSYIIWNGRYGYSHSLSEIIKPTIVTFPEGTTKICDNAFYGCDKMCSFIIPSTVTSIGNSAFEYCSSLHNLIIPKGVETIGHSALTNIDCVFESTIPASLVSEELLGEIGIAIVPAEAYDTYRQADFWHDFMAKIVRADQLKRIVTTTASHSSSGLHVAVGEENLNSVMDLTIMGTINGMDLLVIRNKMKNLRNLDMTDANIVANDDLFDYYQGGFIKADNELGANAFKDMNICSVVLPKSLVAINDNAFNNCSRLKSVYIYDGVKVIGSNAFGSCGKLNDLHMSSNIKVIGNAAFYNCALETLIFGDSLKSIGYEAFHANNNLKSVSLGNGMEILEPGAFSGCSSLEYVDFGNHLVDINHGAFDGCYSLKNVYIPNSVKRIGYEAFSSCYSIDTLYIGHRVEIIEESAFRGCYGLENVTFGKSIKEIGRYAFEGCSNIKTIMLPTSLKYIRYRAFANCTGLKEFKIPSSVEKIENEAFAGNRKLESVYAYTIEPIFIDQNTFSCWEYATLYVPKTSYYTYYLNKQWSQFMTLREFDEPYEYFYLNDDYLLDDETGRIDGVPDMLLNENSGFIVQGDETQQINEIELTHNGTDGASIIGGDGDVTGQIKNLTAKSMKVNIDVEGNRWYFFCFPFNVDLDSIECTSQYVFWRYDGNQRAQQGTGWTKLPEGLTALSKGEGYIFQTNRTGILTIHVGSEYLTFASQNEQEVLHTFTADNPSNASWNFIGNPFISYYDTRDLAEEYDAPIITWNGRSYDVYKPGEEDEEPYQLKPFEAFFVQKASGKQSINFLPDNRLTYNQSVAAKTNFVNQRRAMGTVVNPDRLLVNLSIMDCDSVTDKTRIVYSTNASMDYEIGVDAPKFQSDGVPQLYSLAGGVKYSINERPAGNDEIKLGYVAPKAGVYTLSIPRMDADVEVYDNVLNSRVNFIDGNYDFTTKAGTFNDRFVIYKTGSSVTAIGKDIIVDGLTLHPADGGIDVSGNAAGQDVMVYLPTGALVAKLSADGFISSGLGTFIIKVGERSVKMVVE